MLPNSESTYIVLTRLPWMQWHCGASRAYIVSLLKIRGREKESEPGDRSERKPGGHSCVDVVVEQELACEFLLPQGRGKFKKPGTRDQPVRTLRESGI